MAILGVNQSTPRDWTAHDLDLAGEVAERTWAAVARAIAEAALRASEEKYRTLFNSIDQGFVLLEIMYNKAGEPFDMRYLEINSVFKRQTGLDAWDGKTVLDLFPAIEPEWLAFYSGVVRSGESARMDYHLDAIDRWYTSYASSVGGAGSPLVVVFFDDITDRKQNEARQQLLLHISDKLSAADSHKEVQIAVTDSLHRHFGAGWCYYVEWDEEQKAGVVLQDSKRDDLPSLAGIHDVSDVPEFLELLKSRQILNVSDYEDYDLLSQRIRERYTAAGFRSMLVASLISHDRLISSLIIGDTKIRNWSTNDETLLAEVAERTWAAVERAKAEDALRQNEQKYRALFENIDEAFVLIEPIFDEHVKVRDFLYREENPKHSVNSGLPEVTGKKASELFPNLEPAWLTIFQKVYDTGVAFRGEDYNADTDRWYTYYYSRVGGLGSPLIASVSSDITRRKQTEERQEFLLKLSDALSKLERSREMEQTAMQLLGEQLGVNRAFLATIEAGGQEFSVRQDYANGLTPVTGSFAMTDFQKKRLFQWQAGEMTWTDDCETDSSFNKADREAYAAFGARAAISVPLVKGGRFAGLLSVNQTSPRKWKAFEKELLSEAAERIWAAIERVRAEEALRESEEKLRRFNETLEQEVKVRTAELGESELLLQTIVDSSFTYIQVFQAIRDEKQQIVDYKWRLVNKGFADRYGDMTGRTLIAQNPAVLHTGIFEGMRRVTETGEPVEEEHHYQYEQFDGWFYQILTKLDDGLVMTTADITERKRIELEIQQTRDRLQSVFDTTLVQLSIMEAIRNDKGEIIDLEIRFVNKELEKTTGRDDQVGKRYGQLFPGIYQTGVFDAVVKTIETGRSQQLEYYYPYENFNRWFSSMFVKLNDGVVASNMDITDRKRAEEDRVKNYLLLQQSEELAALGSWDFDLLTKSFSWSDGMYRLFDLKKGIEIQPEIYLEYTTENGRAAAERVVQHIRNGNADFEETLELNVFGRIKIIHLKAVVVKNNEGHAERVLGVDMDISAMRAAEATIRKMEAEQQLEIFRVSLETLEEERHRISESLHNGIGQILYGIKINMSGFRYGLDEAEFKENKAYTSKLLTDAIVETRRISHELMPTTLEQFELKSAIDDVCSQLTDGTKFHCEVKGLFGRMEKYLELAVYRTAQELMEFEELVEGIRQVAGGGSIFM